MATKIRPIETVLNGKKKYAAELRQFKLGRKYFDSAIDCQAFIDANVEAIRDHGLMGVVTVQETAEIRAWKRKLPKGVTPSDVFAYYFAHFRPVQITDLTGAIRQCVDEKREAGRSERYIAKFEDTLNLFACGREGFVVSQIRAEDIKAWLNGKGRNGKKRAATTRKSYLSDLSSFFSWCVRQKFCLTSPCGEVENVNVAYRAPAILTPEQVGKLMDCVRTGDPEMIAIFTLSIFCGIRIEEIVRLDPKDIDIQGRMVRIDSARSKTGQRRIVTIPENAAEWLKSADWNLQPLNWRKRIDRAREAVGLRENWSQGAMRHSFVSYHYAIHGASKTAAEAGHSEAILHRNYRELVTREQAEAFFAVRPVGSLANS